MSSPLSAVSAVAPDLSRRSIVYFSMEIALSPALPTYSGGLGMLAGDTLRSAADTSAPMVAITLAHRKGYFRQKLSDIGQQTEADVPWSPETLPSAGHTVTITIQNRPLQLQAWRFDVVGTTGHIVPVYLLDADVEGNDSWDRHLTDHLYGGDTYYRLCQEAILGLGGIALLQALGVTPEVYHMNEGHAALLTIGLLENRVAQRIAGGSLAQATNEDREAVRQLCVFTTHTPVPAGHDQFGTDQMYQVLGHDRGAAVEAAGGIHNGLMNMSYLALSLSRYVNGVAMQHGKVSQVMFPEYKVHSITNGVHAATWLSPSFQDLFDDEIPDWRTDNRYFRSVYGIDPARISACHIKNKQKLFATLARRTGHYFNPSVLTLGFARRVATYKRAGLLLNDPARLVALAEKIGGLQILYAGKAHPADNAGKALIRDVYEAAVKLNSASLKIYYVENYDWELGALLTQGVDVWVNTPRRPYEASGTSGMKAALNGVPSLSILDGWWIEGCAENTTGWAIEDGETEAVEATSLYNKLEKAVAPLWSNPNAWAKLQQHCIGINGTFFNTHRMLSQYLSNAYFPYTDTQTRVAINAGLEKTTDITLLAKVRK